MTSMLALWPSVVVVMLGPEFSCWPLRLQLMVTGMSPWETTQVSWANAPESMTGDPKENGAILGGSKNTHKLYFRLLKIFPVPFPVTLKLPLTFNCAA